MAGMDDLVNKAKDLLADNADKVDGAVDKAVDAVKNVAPDSLDGAIDGAANAVKDVSPDNPPA